MFFVSAIVDGKYVVTNTKNLRDNIYTESELRNFVDYGVPVLGVRDTIEVYDLRTYAMKSLLSSGTVDLDSKYLEYEDGEIELVKGNVVFADYEELIIPSYINRLRVGCFLGLDCLKYITIPDSVTYIGSGCFHGCTSLVSIVVPASVHNINIMCFSDCMSLKSAQFLAEPVFINSNCFEGCCNLESIIIPKSGFMMNGSLIGCNDCVKVRRV